MADNTQGQAETLFKSLDDNGYKLVTRAEFDAATDVPEGLRERLATMKDGLTAPFIVYDPHDDEEGWCIVGDDKEALARETHDDRIAVDDVP